MTSEKISHDRRVASTVIIILAMILLAMMLASVLCGCNTARVTLPKGVTGQYPVIVFIDQHKAIGNPAVDAALGDSVVNAIAGAIGGATGAAVAGPGGAAVGAALGTISVEQVKAILPEMNGK